MKNVFLYSFLLLIGMFCCVGNLHAEDKETINLANGEYIGSGASAYIVWEGVSCSIKQEKTSLSPYNVSENILEPRLEASHKISFVAKEGYTLLGAEIECTTSGYATSLKNSNISGATATVSDCIVTITPTGKNTNGDFYIVPSSIVKVKSIVIICQSPTGEIDFVATDGRDHYATFSSDHAVRFKNEITSNEGTGHVSVYAVCVSSDGKLELIDQANNNNDETYTSIPANTGVLLKYSTTGEMPLKVAYDLCDVSAAELKAVENNMLRPASAAKETDGSYKFYMLAYGSSNLDNLGFYWGADQGAAFTSREGSAYLAVPASSTGARNGFSFEDDVESIERPSAETSAAAPIYTIEGRLVQGEMNSLSHGLYIVNGKKLMIK